MVGITNDVVNPIHDNNKKKKNLLRDSCDEAQPP